MNRLKRPHPNRPHRRSFTLAELLVVITIIGILAATILFAMYTVVEDAKEARTRAQVAKLHELLMANWEAYRTRALPLKIAPGTAPQAAHRLRLNAVRDLMRMELPDRITDLMDGPASTNPAPSKWRSHRRRAGFAVRYPGPGYDVPPPSWTARHQGAECLYLIVAGLRDGDSSGLDFFKETEIGDIDDDGMREIHDAWGRPIEFLRWAPGFATWEGEDGAWGQALVDDDGANGVDDIGEMGWPGTDDSSDLQVRNALTAPDPFDPARVDRRETFALFPLIFSPGRDGQYDIEGPSMASFSYASLAPPNDPYHVLAGPGQIGRPRNVEGGLNGSADNTLNSVDNITNHSLAVN